MNKKEAPRTIGVFPRGLDGLFWRSSEKAKCVWLVANDTPESLWARSLARDRAIAYRLDPSHPLVGATTGDILAHSDLAEVLLHRRIDALLLHSSFTRQIRDWSKRHGVAIVATPHALARKFEDKIWFDGFLKRSGISRPKSVAGLAGQMTRLPFRRGAVVQLPESMGGEGTFFLRPNESIESLVRLGHVHANSRCLVREYVDGIALGITVLVAPDVVALSAVRQQCYYPTPSHEPHATRRIFAGIQWLSTRDLLGAAWRRIEQTFLDLGRWLFEQRYFGFANLDFILDRRGRVFVIECNPRPSAATPALCVWPELISGFCVDTALLFGSLNRRRWRAVPRLLGVPTSSFCGATLDIVGNASMPQGMVTVKRAPRIGVYKRNDQGAWTWTSGDPWDLVRGPSIFVYSPAERGQHVEAEETVANVMSNIRLYDESGQLNNVGRKIVRQFEVT